MLLVLLLIVFPFPQLLLCILLLFQFWKKLKGRKISCALCSLARQYDEKIFLYTPIPAPSPISNPYQFLIRFLFLIDLPVLPVPSPVPPIVQSAQKKWSTLRKLLKSNNKTKFVYELFFTKSLMLLDIFDDVNFLNNFDILCFLSKLYY